MGKDLLKIVTTRLNTYCEAKGLRPKEQCWPYPHHSTTGIRAGKESVRMAVSVFHQPAEGIRLCRSYTCLAGQVLARFGVSPKVIQVIRQLYHGVRACVRSDAGQRSEFEETSERIQAS